MPKKHSLSPLLWWLPLPVFLCLFLGGLQLRFPTVGIDYLPFSMRLMEGRWHFAHYGLAPMRYALHLCGGMPMYGHPNDLYYSLPQMLALFLDPWVAMQSSMLIFLAVGYVGWWLLGRDVLRFGKEWSHVFALVVTAHGFMYMHVLAGHVNFFTFPLIGWLFWLLLAPRPGGMALPFRLALFALINAVILYTAGYFVLLFFAMLMVLAIPLLIVFRKELALPDIRPLCVRFALSGIAAVALCASKLVAIHALMRVFPRTVEFGVFQPGVSPLLYIFNALWALPQSAGLFVGIPWGIHENSMAVSPIVLLGALIGLCSLLFSSDRHWKHRLFVLLYGIFLFYVCMDLVKGYGPVARLAHLLPFVGSIRVVTRFLYVFSLLVVAGSIGVLRSFTKKGSRRTDITVSCMAFTLLCFVFANYPAFASLPPTNYARIRTQIDHLESINFTKMPAARMTITETKLEGDVGAICSQDDFFVWSHQPQAIHLWEGFVWDIRGGRYNLINPSCYADGAANNCQPTDRIRVSDSVNFNNFISGGPLTWKFSLSQRLADGFSLLSLVAALACVAWPVVRRVRAGR